MDFIEGLPMIQGKSTILVIVDKLSKYAHFLPVKHPYTAVSVAEIFLSNVYKLHGMPTAIISDRDPVFTSLFWQELFRKSGVKLQLTTAYHPQSDGQTEVVNRCLENYLRCMCTSQPRDWMKWLPLAEYWYNTSHHSSLNCTPYEVLYGQPPPLHVPYLPGDSNVETVDRTLRSREEQLQAVRRQLLKAQERMKFFADSKRREKEYGIGDWVYLKLQPFRQKSLPQGRLHKLSPKYAGPFEIIERVGPVAYRLRLPDEAKIHNVFHVSLLKEKVGTETVTAELPELEEEEAQDFEPEIILDRGMRKAKGKAIPEVIWLIKWKALPTEAATWESAAMIKQRFPAFQT